MTAIGTPEDVVRMLTAAVGVDTPDETVEVLGLGRSCRPVVLVSCREVDPRTGTRCTLSRGHPPGRHRGPEQRVAVALVWGADYPRDPR